MPKPEVNTKTIVTMALLSVLGLNTARTVSQNGGASGASSPSSGLRTAESALAPPTAESYREKLSDMVAGAQRPLSVLVATVPDPDQTGLRIYTDRALDAIQLAAFHRKYVLMKHWVPWKTGPDRLDDTYSSRRAQAQENAAKAQFPGMLVFEDSAADGSMVVLLVPDTPTSGVNIPVLQEALGLLTDSNGNSYPKGSKDPACKVTLVGPSFSGGLHGLNDFIVGNRGGCISRVITGPATGISPGFLQGLGADSTNPANPMEPPAARSVPLNWVRTQQSESRGAVEDYLFAQRELGLGLISRGRVLRLVEDATGFAIALADGVAQGKANIFTDPETNKTHVFAIEQTGRPFEPGRVLSIKLDGTETEVSKVLDPQELILKDAWPSKGEVRYEFNPRSSPTYSHFGTALLSADGQTLTRPGTNWAMASTAGCAGSE